MNKIRILLADDHAVVRAGLAAILGLEPDFEVVAEAENGNEAVERAAKFHPDVIIMDLMMPALNGADATRQILAAEQSNNLKSTNRTIPRVLILTTYGSSDDLAKALKAGATGAVMKTITHGELADTIRRVARGELVVAPEIAKMLEAESPIPELTERQRSILESLTRGLSNTEIAIQFGISSSGVKQHLNAIFAKLGAANRSEAVAIALRKQLLKS